MKHIIFLYSNTSEKRKKVFDEIFLQFFFLTSYEKKTNKTEWENQIEIKCI